MDLAEPPGRAAGGTAPMIVAGLDGSPAGACGIHAPWKPNGTRPPAPVFVVPPLASRLGMPPATLDAERRARAQHHGSGTPHPCRIG